MSLVALSWVAKVTSQEVWPFHGWEQRVSNLDKPVPPCLGSLSNAESDQVWVLSLYFQLAHHGGYWWRSCLFVFKAMTPREEGILLTKNFYRNWGLTTQQTCISPMQKTTSTSWVISRSPSRFRRRSSSWSRAWTGPCWSGTRMSIVALRSGAACSTYPCGKSGFKVVPPSAHKVVMKF